FIKEKYPIVGIAKNEFRTSDSQRRNAVRGESKTPLFVTAKGINVDEVQLKVQQMHGDYRMPTLLKRLDQLSRA
ncbi:MAG: endonuclease V, partial [Chryseobacterium cucumeris]